MQQRNAIPAAKAGFQRESFAARRPRNASHPSRKGSSRPSDGWVIRANPHSKPESHHSLVRCGESASCSVAHKRTAPSSAARHVSHTHSNGIITALGYRAQSQAAPLAGPKPPIRLPVKKIGIHANEEKSVLRKTTTKNDFALRIPKMRNTPATSRG